MITKEILERHLLVERKTIGEVAQLYGVHRNTVGNWVKEYGIDPKGWWRYQSIICSECSEEIDKGREFPESKRKNLLIKSQRLCDSCRIEYRRRQKAEWTRRDRDKDRVKYNAYMREYRAIKQGIPIQDEKE